MRKNDLIKAYSEALLHANAGLFIGAGLSLRAGYPSWRRLVRDMARDVGLDVERESDLPGVVQYFLNKAGKTRTRLAHTIVDHFGEERPIPEVFRILARLPLRHIWTSNYETLAERAWRDHRKRLDVKSRDKDLVQESPWAHGMLYKMHGTVDHPADVVIAKGDYESYRRTRPGFLHLLTGQLVSRRMLFLGISFTDPNLNHLFTVMREAFEDTPPEHYTIVRRPKRADYKTAALYNYAKRRHGLWVDDLQNYGIQTVEVDEYEEIDEILEAVEQRLSVRSVLVSGSFPDTHAPADLDQRARIERTAHAIGRMLARHDYRLVSGFGLVVGSAALSGALDELNRQATPNLDQSLFLRPFPQLVPAGMKPKDYYRRYREDLVTQAGACVFIAGLKDAAGRRVNADGVIAEFEFAAAAKRVPIPVAATGGAAADIWRRVKADYRRYCGKLPKTLFNALNDTAASPERLAKSVEEILAWLKQSETGI
jgi:SLOG family protein/SIR2-like protein